MKKRTILKSQNLKEDNSAKGKRENDDSGKGNPKKDKYEQEQFEKGQFRKGQI